MRIAHFGTFDVDDYGDPMFAHGAEGPSLEGACAVSFPMLGSWPVAAGLEQTEHLVRRVGVRVARVRSAS